MFMVVLIELACGITTKTALEKKQVSRNGILSGMNRTGTEKKIMRIDVQSENQPNRKINSTTEHTQKNEPLNNK